MLVVLAVHLAAALCPFAGAGGGNEVPAHRGTLEKAADPTYDAAVRALPLEAVKADLRERFVTPDPMWPPDYGHYGPLFIRLAWHCSGSYRVSDGRGGCAGGRQRFEPERSWPDNTNLDKARALLWPIKKKYGKGLSWGDLFILAGTTAIEDMGGPVLGFCAGRPDDEDGTESLPLGPTPEQQARWPCPTQGACPYPFGSTTMGLIYVNPEGHMGVPDPEGSVYDVRSSFGRMAMNDSETVALIAGGHTFGRTHGACPAGAGPAPKDAPDAPWPGRCGSGKGPDTYTSGLDGPWTPTPTQWDNKYLETLLLHPWEKYKGPGGAWQWKISRGQAPMAPPVGPGAKAQAVMMLTTDQALLNDPNYKAIVMEWARAAAGFDRAFASAWYKLVTRDMGPVTRCVGPLVPPAQDWQFPLPPPPAPSAMADFNLVTAAVRSAVAESRAANPGTHPAADITRLAFRCAATFRATDYRGGCNGARIRLSPERDWLANRGIGDALALLAPIKGRFGSGLSWADLIVLAGTRLLEDLGAPALPFCPGRTDASDGRGSEYLEPVLADAAAEGDVSASAAREAVALSGLSVREWVALRGRRSVGLKFPPFGTGPWTAQPDALSNAYFQNLVDVPWVNHTLPARNGAPGAVILRPSPEAAAVPGSAAAAAAAAGITMLASDVAILRDPELASVAMDFASDEAGWKQIFARAWTKLMNADRFSGPTGNLCA